MRSIINRSISRLSKGASYGTFLFTILSDKTQRKFVFRWLKSFEKNYQLKQGQPWLSFGAIDFLDSSPLEGKRFFEYGSGGSTLYWLSRKMTGISIEHDPVWFNLIRDYLRQPAEIEYRLVQPERMIMEEPRDISNPHLYLSDDPPFREHSFVDYVKQIDDFPDDSFDVVLIDGRARASCLKHSVTKVKIGGCIILDNSERPHYLEKTSSLLGNFQRQIFKGTTPGANWFTETSVFLRTV